MTQPSCEVLMELWAGDMSFLSTYRCSNCHLGGWRDGCQMGEHFVQPTLSENRCFFFEGMMVRIRDESDIFQIFEQMQVLGWRCELLSQMCWLFVRLFHTNGTQQFATGFIAATLFWSALVAESSWVTPSGFILGILMAKMSDTKPFDLKTMNVIFWMSANLHQTPIFPFFFFQLENHGVVYRFGGRSLGFFEASEASKVCQREGAEGLNSFFGRQPDRWDAPRSKHAGCKWRRLVEGWVPWFRFCYLCWLPSHRGVRGFWTIFYSFSSCQLSIFLWEEVSDFEGIARLDTFIAVMYGRRLENRGVEPNLVQMAKWTVLLGRGW